MFLVPRLAGDGEETNIESSIPFETSKSTHLVSHRTSRPVFLDGENRNSTDIALKERQRQRDVELLPAGNNILVQGYASQLEEWKGTVARQEKELDKLKAMLAHIEKDNSRLQDIQLQLQADLTLQTQVNKCIKTHFNQ